MLNKLFYHILMIMCRQMIINHGVRGSIPNPSYQTLGYGGNTPCVEFKTKNIN